jgi:hypothetical protein
MKIEKAEVRQMTDRERSIVVNGLKFFVCLGDDGRRYLNTCHQEKKLLQSAAAYLEANGYETKVKASDEKGYFLLSAKERIPSGKEKWDEGEKLIGAEGGTIEGCFTPQIAESVSKI